MNDEVREEIMKLHSNRQDRLPLSLPPETESQSKIIGKHGITLASRLASLKWSGMIKEMKKKSQEGYSTISGEKQLGI